MSDDELTDMVHELLTAVQQCVELWGVLGAQQGERANRAATATEYTHAQAQVAAYQRCVDELLSRVTSIIHTHAERDGR